MAVHRLQSPFQHWFRGLLLEIVALALYLGSLFGLAWAVWWLL